MAHISFFYKVYIAFALHCTIIHYVHGDFYTSVYKLSLLIEEEQRLTKALRKYIGDVTLKEHDIPGELHR